MIKPMAMLAKMLTIFSIVSLSAGIDTQVQPKPHYNENKYTELMLIDSAVPDKSAFYAVRPAHMKIIELNADKNGIEQLLNILASYQQQPISALHIVSHGSDGKLYLAEQGVDNTALNQYQDQIKALRHVFADEADLLLYGCDVAASDKGKSFVNQLSELFAVDVVASDNKTGDARHGADWQFEYHYGRVQTDPLLVKNYSYILAVDDMEDYRSSDINGLVFTGKLPTPTPIGYTITSSGGWTLPEGFDFSGYADFENTIDGRVLLSNSSGGNSADVQTFEFDRLVDITSLGLLFVQHYEGQTYELKDTTGVGSNTHNSPIQISHSDLAMTIDGGLGVFYKKKVALGWTGVKRFTITTSPSPDQLQPDTVNIIFDNLVASEAIAADTTPPSVSGITVSGLPVTSASTMGFEVNFNETANNISTDDFTLTTTGSATGNVASVSASSGSTVTVTVNNISGDGGIKLDLNPSSNISDDEGNGDGNNGHVAAFTSGEIHTVDTLAPIITQVSIADSAYKVGDSVPVTILVNSDLETFSLVSGTVAGRSLSNLTKVNNGKYTAEFAIVNGSTDLPAADDIAVSVVLSDLSANANSAYTTAISQSNDAIYANLPKISISANTSSIQENAGTSTVSAVIDSASSLNAIWPDDITVNLAYSGTASAGTDYSKVDSITINAGQSSGTGELQAIADNVYDATTPETVITSLDSLSIGTIDTAARQITITVIDQQIRPQVELSVGATNIAENAGSTSITATINNATFENVTVQLGYSGSASNTDYNAAASSIVIPAGQLTGSTTVTAVDDSEEDADTIIIDVLNVNGGHAQEAGIQQKTITIVDDDDTTSPQVTNVAVPANNTYIKDDALRFTVTFNETVNITNTPSLTIKVGAQTKSANYISGSGSTLVIFEYQVEADLIDSDGIELMAFAAPLSNIKDAAGNELDPTLNAVPDLSNVLVDSTLPVVMQVTANSADGHYKEGQEIVLAIQFSEKVNVTGVPQLLLDTSGAGKYAQYSSGSSSNTLIFNYTVQANDNSLDLSYKSANALDLNNGTIKDVATNNADLTLPSPGTDNSLSDNHAIVLDTIAPSVTLVSDNTALKLGETTDVHFTLSEVNTSIELTDITVVGGNLSSFAANGIHYTALFTPNTEFMGDATINVLADSFQDEAGNGNIDATELKISVDTIRPSGHSVSIVQNTINSENETALSFKLMNAEVGTRFTYQITDGQNMVTDNGNVANAEQTISGINVAALEEGVLTLSVILEDTIGNQSVVVTDTVNKSYDVAPVANDDIFSTEEDTVKVYDLLANDTDLNNDLVAASATIKNQPTKGTVTIVNGVVTYTPNANVSGEDSFEYTVKDSLLQESEQGTVTITINPVNDNPVAAALVINTNEDTKSVALNARGASTDIEDTRAAGELVITRHPANGLVEIDQAQGSFTYTPNADMFGHDSFAYTITDSQGAVSNVATVNVNIGSVNDEPVAVNDVANFEEDTIYTFNILNNDSDLEDQNLLTSNITLEDQGNGEGVYEFATVTVEPSGITVDPTDNINGQFSFTYFIKDSEQIRSNTATVTLNIQAVNDAPVAVDNQAQLLEEGQYELNVLGNDIDYDDGDTFDLSSLTIVSGPSNGATEITQTGSIIYTPYTNYFGEDTFTYKVKDSVGALSNIATVTMTVTAVNDKPTATAQTKTITEDSNIVIRLNATDIDGDNLSYQISQLPIHGQLEQVDDENWRYTPEQNFFGNDTFSFIANDGQLDSEPADVSVNVTPVNDQPVVEEILTSVDEDSSVDITLLGSDIDKDELIFQVISPPLNGVISISGDQISYQPAQDFNGEDSFDYIATDSQLVSNIASVKITVNNINDAPEISGKPASAIAQNQTYLFTPKASDIDADTLSFSIENKPNWALFDTSSGTLTGTLTRADVGRYENIIIRVSDGSMSDELSAFAITVISVNSAPLISGTPASNVDQDELYVFTPSAQDDDGDELNFTIVNKPSWASFDIKTGQLTGTPSNDDIGETQGIVIEVSDGNETASLADFSITVNNVNDAPQAINDNYTFTQNQTNGYVLDVLANDIDIDQDILLLDWASAVNKVSVVDNKIILMEAKIGTFTIQYGISDGNGGEDKATVVVTITSAALDAPTIVAPADITVNATGLFTRVELGVAVANDSNGAVLPVMLVDNKTHLKPGINTVFWSTEDAQGNKAQDSQIVSVHPLISFEKDHQTTEGTKHAVKVMLNGPSPSYPVKIPYTVSGSADSNDHNLQNGEIEILSGTETFLEFDVLADNVSEGSETIVIALDNTLNLGTKSSYQLKIDETNLAPNVVIELTLESETVSQLISKEGTASVISTVTDPNALDSHLYKWTTPQDSLAILINGQQQQAQLSFNPAELTPGMYQLTLTVRDNATEPLAITKSLYFEVVAAQAKLTSVDSDGDLIPDDQEGHTDQDGDGIPDYLDAILQCNVLQQRASQSDIFLVEAEPGACLRKGVSIASNLTGGAELLDTELADDDQANYIGGIYDFVIKDLPQIGQSYQLVIPQRLPIPADAVYRKYRPEQGWIDFVINEQNTVSSSIGEPGYCPPPGDVSWQEGLAEGHWCVQVTIEDGGPNDDDGLANGEIVDPSGVAVYVNSNSLPVSEDDVANVARNASLSIDVLSNDTDADADSLIISNASATIGDVSIVNNQLLYQAADNYFGEDVITYGVTDGKGGTSSAHVFVTVINSRAPNAVNDHIITTEGKSIIINALANDTDPDGDQLTLVEVKASHGSVKINSDNSISYTPAKGFTGIDTINYMVQDKFGLQASATVQVDVKTKPELIKNSGSFNVYWLLILAFYGLYVRRPTRCKFKR